MGRLPWSNLDRRRGFVGTFARTQRGVWTAALSLALILGGCSEAAAPPAGCDARPLPFAGGAGGPTVTDAILYVEGGTAVTVSLTVTHPAGDDALLELLQTVGVFQDRDCQGGTLEVTDDLAGSGLEESFGTVLTSGTHPALFEEIAGSNRWPVEVDVTDSGGNPVQGRVEARVRR